MADLRKSAILVIGHHLNVDGDTPRPISLVSNLFVLLARELSRPLLYCSLDVVAGHVGSTRRLDGCPEPGVACWISPADSCRYRYLFDDLGKNLAALGVESAFRVLDIAPLGMAGHH